ISETERLLEVIADLKAHGISVIYISHRLGEIMTCADRVVVLRDGRTVGELARDELSHSAMIRLMIGRDLKALHTPPKRLPPRDAIRQGIYLVPEDRKKSGLVLELPIRENVTLASLLNYARMWLVNGTAERKVAKEQVRRLSIKAPSIDMEAVTLSGGNQQKVVLGKWLSMQPRVMFFDEHTRGLDGGGKSDVYAP